MNTGDLIFSQIGPDANAISDVTEGFRGARPDHMGVIIENPIGIFVLEAFPPEVRITHIDVFLRRSRTSGGDPGYMLGRINNEFHSLIPDAIAYGLRQRDIPYDRRYLTDPAQLYCSELVVDMYKYANSGEAFFPEHPMSFRDLETGIIKPYWIQYYQQFGMSVPHGEPGSNPGTISLDPRLDIYRIEGPMVGLRDP